jgi:Flp pilus assembly pilin Flp
VTGGGSIPRGAGSAKKKLDLVKASFKQRRTKMIMKFLREENGMEMVEWSLVAVLFALVAGLAFTGVGTAVAGALGNIATRLAGV